MVDWISFFHITSPHFTSPHLTVRWMTVQIHFNGSASSITIYSLGVQEWGFPIPPANQIGYLDTGDDEFSQITQLSLVCDVM
jgi:hypothetical protein